MIMGTKQLTMNQKAKFEPMILVRDFPNGETPVCFYCEQRFLNNNKKWCRTWDHLDNDESHNYPENFVFAHWNCNQNKKFNIDWQILAQEKLQENLKLAFEFTRERNKISNTDEPTEIDLNVAHRKITQEFLVEKLSVDEKLDFVDTINCITLRCENQTGHGSKQSVRNYLDVLSCSEGKYRKFKEGGKTWISKRLGQ